MGDDNMGLMVITGKNIQDLPIPKGAIVDDPISAIVKLIPGEVISIWVFAEGIIKASSLNLWMSIIVFVICLVLTPMFRFITLKKEVGSVDKVPTWQIGIPTFAFLFWMSALGGPFLFIPGYSTAIGSIAVFIYTIAAGYIYKWYGEEPPRAAPHP